MPWQQLLSLHVRRGWLLTALVVSCTSVGVWSTGCCGSLNHMPSWGLLSRCKGGNETPLLSPWGSQEKIADQHNLNQVGSHTFIPQLWDGNSNFLLWQIHKWLHLGITAEQEARQPNHVPLSLAYLSIYTMYTYMFRYNYVCMFLFVVVCQNGYNMQPWPVASIQC